MLWRYFNIVCFITDALLVLLFVLFFFSSRRRHTRCLSDWSSDVCSSDLEHLAWSSFDGCVLPDLLPFPRTRAALTRIADNIDIVQSALRRRILVENP